MGWKSFTLSQKLFGYVKTIPVSFSWRHEELSGIGAVQEQIVHTHQTSCCSWFQLAVDREGLVNQFPTLTSEYSTVSQWIPFLLLSHFRYGASTCSYCTKVWHRTYPICDAPLSLSARSVTDIASKSPHGLLNSVEEKRFLFE